MFICPSVCRGDRSTHYIDSIHQFKFTFLPFNTAIKRGAIRQYTCTCIYLTLQVKITDFACRTNGILTLQKIRRQLHSLIGYSPTCSHLCCIYKCKSLVWKEFILSDHAECEISGFLHLTHTCHQRTMRHITYLTSCIFHWAGGHLQIWLWCS